MTVARVSQEAVEVLRTSTGVKVRQSQLAVEVLRLRTDIKVRASQVAIEVLRHESAGAAAVRPLIIIVS